VKFGRILLLIVLVGFGIRVAYVAITKGGSCVSVLATARNGADEVPRR
jgi:uncharacterized protein (UPF0333 family)